MAQGSAGLASHRACFSCARRGQLGEGAPCPPACAGTAPHACPPVRPIPCVLQRRAEEGAIQQASVDASYQQLVQQLQAERARIADLQARPFACGARLLQQAQVPCLLGMWSALWFGPRRGTSRAICFPCTKALLGATAVCGPTLTARSHLTRCSARPSRRRRSGRTQTDASESWSSSWRRSADAWLAFRCCLILLVVSLGCCGAMRRSRSSRLCCAAHVPPASWPLFTICIFTICSQQVAIHAPAACAGTLLPAPTFPIAPSPAPRPCPGPPTAAPGGRGGGAAYPRRGAAQRRAAAATGREQPHGWPAGRAGSGKGSCQRAAGLPSGAGSGDGSCQGLMDRQSHPVVAALVAAALSSQI